MRHSAGLMRFVASATLTLIVALPTYAAAQTKCEAKRLTCTAECRARYFTIDARRDECIAKCISEENKCKREQASYQAESYASSNSEMSRQARELLTFLCRSAPEAA